MPTIVSICPYCRAGGVRAPQSNIGASATCPNCKSSFTVMPSDGLPGWAKEPQPAPPPARPQTVPADETRPAAAMGMADVTEPSPLLPDDERSKIESQPAAAPASPALIAEPDEESVPDDLGMVVALVALILVGIAVVASQFPYGRIIGGAIALVGVAGGVASLGAEGRAKLAAGLAIALNGLVMLVVVLLPSWLNLDSWRGPPAVEGPQGPVALEHGTRNVVPISANDWVEAGRSSWGFKDVNVTVRSAYISPVELTGANGKKRKTKESYFHLRLRIVNAGVERDFALTGWAIGQNAAAMRIVDQAGNVLKPATFEDGVSVDRGTVSDRLFPDQSSEPRLIFTAPPTKVDWLRVQLPGTAVGVPEEEIKFQIGAGFLNRNAVPGAPSVP